MTSKLPQIVASLIALLSLVLVGMGGYVRGTGAGLSCPDWPLCYGRAVPADFGNGVMQEVVHRYTASAVSALALLFAYLSFRGRLAAPAAWNAARLALVVLVLQIVLGGLTVLMKLNPFIVTAHLALGTVFFQTFAFLALARRDREVVAELPNARPLALLAVLLFLQMLVGGFVGASGAAYACGDLPFCAGDGFLPIAPTHQQEIHMLHRGLALVVFFGVSILTLRSLGSASAAFRNFLLAAWLLTVVQIVLGSLNVLLHVPVHVAVTHLLVAQLMLCCLLQANRIAASVALGRATARTISTAGLRSVRTAGSAV